MHTNLWRIDYLRNGFLGRRKDFRERERDEQEPRTHTSKWYQVP